MRTACEWVQSRYLQFTWFTWLSQFINIHIYIYILYTCIYNHRRVREVRERWCTNTLGTPWNCQEPVQQPLRISLLPRDRIRWASAEWPASGLPIECQCMACHLERLQSTYPKNIGNLRFSSESEQLRFWDSVFGNIAPTCTNQLCILVVEFHLVW